MRFFKLNSKLEISCKIPYFISSKEDKFLSLPNRKLLFREFSIPELLHFFSSGNLMTGSTHYTPKSTTKTIRLRLNF